MKRLRRIQDRIMRWPTYLFSLRDVRQGLSPPQIVRREYTLSNVECFAPSDLRGMGGVAPEGAPALWLLHETFQIHLANAGRSGTGSCAGPRAVLPTGCRPRSLSSSGRYVQKSRTFWGYASIIETNVSCGSYLAAKALPRVLHFLTVYYSIDIQSCQGYLSIRAKISQK